MSKAVARKELEIDHAPLSRAGEEGPGESSLVERLEEVQGLLGEVLREIKEVSQAVEVLSLESAHDLDDISGEGFHQQVRRYRVGLIEGALQRTGGNQVRAARLLGMNVTTLNAMIKRYGINAAHAPREEPARLRASGRGAPDGGVGRITQAGVRSA